MFSLEPRLADAETKTPTTEERKQDVDVDISLSSGTDGVMSEQPNNTEGAVSIAMMHNTAEGDDTKQRYNRTSHFYSAVDGGRRGIEIVGKRAESYFGKQL